jgi:penicillin-binding protein 2
MQQFKVPLEQREKIGLTAVSIVILILAAGLAKLQIFEHTQRAKQSEDNRIRVVPVVPPRGVVMDREGRTIIDNRPSYTVSVVPAEMTAITLPNLSQLLGMDALELQKQIQKNTISRYQPALVKRDVQFPTVAVLEEQAWKFPGVDIQMEQVRQYIERWAVEAFTGYVGEVSRQDLMNVKEEDYRLGSMIGKKGLDKKYAAVLRGVDGPVYKEITAWGQVLGEYQEKPPEPAVLGADLLLTVDVDLQHACTEVLDTFCCGAVVAVDPRNGEVLALASYPGYNANMFSSVMSDSLWQAIANNPAHPLLNRPLNGLYPPGSTAKLVTVGAALEEGIITATSTLKPCTGGFRLGERVFHCWQQGGHGSLTAPHAIEQSCDVFMYQLGLKLGVDKLSHYFAGCGFGQPTDIDLPGESVGLNPDSKYFDRQYGRNKWTRALALNLSIGQGELLVTPLQLAQFFCGLANNGRVYRPHVVKAIVTPAGDTINTPSKVSFKLPFSQTNLSVLKEGLRLVVEGDHGTARALRNPKYAIGGKTGTAQNPHGEDHSWFVGIAPLEAPEIVVCVIVENAGHGSEVAAPIAGKIIETYMKKKRDGDRIAMGREETAE